MSASPPEPPTIRDFILEATSQADVRSRWEAAFAEETAEQWVALERTALLKRLASLGIPLAERQRLANAVGRWRRKLEFAVKSRPVYLSADDVPQPAGGNATRQEIRQKILSEEDEDSVYTGGDGGMVRINTQGKPPLSTWAADFAECGDSSCGCYRLTWPHVRADFRNVVVLRTADAARRHGGALGAVRYVSVGCGSLLTDFEILCGLQAQRIPIASVCVADTAYEKLDQRHRSCFELLAGLFYPARVAAFGSLEHLHGAALADPEAFGRATTYVHCDAEPIDSERSRALAEQLLVAGGHGFLLRNHGHSEPAVGIGAHDGSNEPLPEHNRQCWQRTSRGIETIALAPAEGRHARLLAVDGQAARGTSEGTSSGREATRWPEDARGRGQPHAARAMGTGSSHIRAGDIASADATHEASPRAPSSNAEVEVEVKPDHVKQGDDDYDDTESIGSNDFEMF